MPSIPDVAQKVPLMFQAQTNGRCQIQRLIPKADEQQAERWADEWIDKTYPTSPSFGASVQTSTYAITWRFVTNGGQDDGVIRPVLGAKGWPYYPGSSMKGVFRRACTPAQADRYCGKDMGRDGMQPGILRFLGGYPTDTKWTEQLVDIVHPQQDWQVKERKKAAGAFIQISLYEPELEFGITSNEELDAEEWSTIWGIWDRAISAGIGCRVSAGYGQPVLETRPVRLLYSTQLKGQGQAAKLITGEGEFRPNIFRAAIRGHALRIFGGLTDADTADTIVNELFGSVKKGGNVGLLNMAFRSTHTELELFGEGKYEQPVYDVEGQLTWSLTKALPEDQTKALRNLVGYLVQFSMVLGGFGKSWRRADHRLFLPDYADQKYKPMIGCHWQWSGHRSLLYDVQVRKPEQVGKFINSVREKAETWMQLQGVNPRPRNHAQWREAWHPSLVEVWGRVAEGAGDTRAIHWLHRPYQEAILSARIPEGSIYRSSLTGQMSQIGRLWHRMYPVVLMRKNPSDPTKRLPALTPRYLELLTLFPDTSKESEQFLDFLDRQEKYEKGFKRVWPMEDS